MILWDLKNSFDTIDIMHLFREVEAVGLPMCKLALSMSVHTAPRRLRLGTTIGRPIQAMGVSILAGCKRSTQFARVYTLRLVNGLAYRFAARQLPYSVTLYQHVDDMSALVVANDKRRNSLSTSNAT